MSEQKLNPFLPHQPRSPHRQRLASATLGDAGEKAMHRLERRGIISVAKGVLLPEAASDSSSRFEVNRRERDEEESMKLRPGEFFLTGVPHLTHLPSEDELVDQEGDGYRFQHVIQELRAGQSMEELKWGSEQLVPIGITEKRHQELLTTPLFEKSGRVIAKILDIVPLIEKVCAGNPQHALGLSTEEVLDEMDRLGYRPASLSEILAFARDVWKPEMDAEREEGDEERFFTVDCLVALRARVRAEEHECAIGLSYSPLGRNLGAAWPGMKWVNFFRFLMVRKEE